MGQFLNLYQPYWKGEERKGKEKKGKERKGKKIKDSIFVKVADQIGLDVPIG